MEENRQFGEMPQNVMEIYKKMVQARSGDELVL
jgi:hypothetical protein